jgi:7-keto-8-aminopelargonate synthetase-like enzyme
MAKTKHNNFLDTVDEVLIEAKKAGVVHLDMEDEELSGRRVRIGGRDHFHFGTTGYLGLEQDQRLKDAAISAIQKMGTQFPLSKSYISHPLYKQLEDKLEEMFNHPVVITKNSTLGHIGVIPSMVRDEDAVILDHQVHWSVQNAAQVLKLRGIPVELVRHNNLNMLEDKIKELSTKHAKIWYMADGVYSMFGDYAPVAELIKLSERYAQLHLYFDDVHGMSWIGKHGTGYVMSELKELPSHVVLLATLSKTFGASGAAMVTSDRKLHNYVKNFGGPLTFSAQLEPASVAAALASAKIHLSDEIYFLQRELAEKIDYFNSLLEQTTLPLADKNNCPVFFIGTGAPITGYNFVNRIMSEGFYVNLGLFPAVPVKNTGVRITVSRHNQKEEIKALVDAMVYHYPKALEETNTSENKVRKAFRMPLLENKNDEVPLPIVVGLSFQQEDTIVNISKVEWNSLLGKNSVFDWDGLLFLENVFKANVHKEHNWVFKYFVIRDNAGVPILMTFLTNSLWKEDMLAPASVSVQLEEKRKSDPYYLTSNIMSMGSPFTEGQHYYLDQSHAQWQEAFRLLLDKVEALIEKDETSMLVLRDFVEDDRLNKYLHNQGFIKVVMPESCVLEHITWTDLDGYLATLSTRSRKHFKQDIQPYEAYFDIEVTPDPTDEDVRIFQQLFENVKAVNFDLNTFSFPEKLFRAMRDDPNWEFIVMRLKPEHEKREERLPVGVMFCYKNMGHTYVPSFVGMDYSFVREFQVYRQLLYQTIKRGTALGFKKIDFGMSASFEKRKVGATIVPKLAYVQAKDNFNMELMGMMQNR